MTNSGEDDIFPNNENGDLAVADENNDDSIGEDELDRINELIGQPKQKASNGISKLPKLKRESSSKTEPKTKKQLLQEKLEIMKLECQKQVKTVIKQLKTYKIRDEQAIEKGEPAMSKIQHIDKILETLNKQEVQKGFMKEGGLDLLKLWLDKIPNGPEPSVSLQKKLLNFIYGLSIKRKHLQGIKLGKVIYRISEKSNVKELKMLAQRIVEKWSKILNAKSADESSGEDEEGGEKL